MIIKISVLAGEIWSYLEKEDQTTITNLVRKINGTRDEILLALGWLFKEGHVIVCGEGSNYVCALREKVEKDIACELEMKKRD